MDTIETIAAAIEQGNKQLDELAKLAKRSDERLNDLETREAKSSRPRFSHAPEDIGASSSERKAFRDYLRSGGAPQWDEAKSNSIGSGPDGGYAVPKVIDGMINNVAVNISPIRQIARVVQISTPDYHQLVNLRGTASSWAGETEARSSTNTSQLADISPPMGELYANPQATQTMLDDVFFNADGWLAEEVGVEFARAEGAAFVNGTGVKQPMGFMSYPVAATGDATRAFGTLEYYATGVSGDWPATSATVSPTDCLFTLMSKLKPLYRPGSCWVMSPATMFAVSKLKDNSGRYVLTPVSEPGIPATLFGFPVIETPDMPEIAASSYSIAFGNFTRGYLIVDRIGTRVLRDPFSNKPYVGFYCTKRVGGAVTNSEAIKLLKFATS